MKSGGVQFSIQFLLVLHHGFANAKQVLWCKSNQEKLENTNKKLNTAHITHNSVETFLTIADLQIALWSHSKLLHMD